MNLQTFYFYAALIEQGIPTDDAHVDHFSGRCFHPRIGQRGLVFPVAHVNKIRSLQKEKGSTYFFMGNLNQASRDWVLAYPNVHHSSYGRDTRLKYTFHKEYFDSLSRSRYGLSPTGDCPWSYRFFEAVLCDAIPVIGKNEVDIYANDFLFYRHESIGPWTKEIVEHNFSIFCKHHLLSS